MQIDIVLDSHLNSQELTDLGLLAEQHGINALWNAMYRIISEATGVPVDALPPRVMRLKASEVLSKWLGESDKQLARFFQEVDQLVSEPFEAPDGRQWQLPILVIAEEIDALARARGEDGVHDRILATLRFIGLVGSKVLRLR